MKALAPKVILFFRKSFPGQFSIENVFHALVPHMQKELDVSTATLPYPSQGVLTRWNNGRFARKHQGAVNHITGDVNFIALFLKGKRTVLTVHDCEFIHRATGLKRWLLLHLWLKWPVQRVGWVTTISQVSKEDVIALTGVASEKVRIIHNPMTLTPPTTLAKHTNPKPIVLHIGTKENKNLERLLEALSGLNVQLHIIGPLKTIQIALLDQYNLDYESSMDLTASELSQAYAKADLLAFVSTSEGFGLPIIEAQAHGCPVITSNCSSMPEVAGEAAHLVDPYDISDIRASILKVLNTVSYRSALISRGFENIKRFEPEIIARQYQDVYLELMST